MSVTHVSRTLASADQRGLDARTALLAAIIAVVFIAGLFGAFAHPTQTIGVEAPGLIAGP